MGMVGCVAPPPPGIDSASRWRAACTGSAPPLTARLHHPPCPSTLDGRCYTSRSNPLWPFESTFRSVPTVQVDSKQARSHGSTGDGAHLRQTGAASSVAGASSRVEGTPDGYG